MSKQKWVLVKKHDWYYAQCVESGQEYPFLHIPFCVYMQLSFVNRLRLKIHWMTGWAL